MKPENMNEQIQHNDLLRMIGQHAAEILHELRSPLAGIRGQLQLMERLMAKEGIHNFAERFALVYEEISRMGGLLDQFLQLAGTQELELKPLYLEQMANQVMELLRGLVISRQISYQLLAEPGLPPVLGDERKLKQVLINLIVNALDAGSPGGELRISLRADSGRQFLCVADNGAGIGPEALARIWEPFFTTKPTGSGLGLAISNQIAKEHGGSLIAESTPGEGSCFSLCLPSLT